MKYANKEMKIGHIIASFNQNQINLIPPFQRGTVWNLKARQRLLVNMLRERPIPAIFLYREPSGDQFSYNILDGKQRLESLILFVGDKNPGLKVEHVKDYFFSKPAAGERNFKVKLDDTGTAQGFSGLDKEIVRKFREYAIAVIEIDLDDETTSMDEIVNLFIDINQTGIKVHRFDVAKALRKDKLFAQVLTLIARKEVRKGKSLYYKAIASDFVYVLKRLRLVARVADRNSKVDRMWERLTEIALFARSGAHRSPADILRGFIKSKPQNEQLTKQELRRLRDVFKFLASAYRKSSVLMGSRLATDQPQFYTMVTTLLSSDLVEKYSVTALTKKLTAFSKLVDGKSPAPKSLAATIAEVNELAAKQTTHPSRRKRRQELLVETVGQL